MPRELPADEASMEVTALAQELVRIADLLIAHDGPENRAHRAMSMNGQHLAVILSALIAGDEKEAAMLRLLRARANAVRVHSRSLTARLAGVGDSPEPEYALPLFAEIA